MIINSVKLNNFGIYYGEAQYDFSVEGDKKLIDIENSFYGMKHRSGILNEIGKTMKQDWVHEEIIKDFLDIEEGA